MAILESFKKHLITRDKSTFFKLINISETTLNFKTGYNLFALPPFEIFYDTNNQQIHYNAKTILEKMGAGSELYRWDDEQKGWKSTCIFESKRRC